MKRVRKFGRCKEKKKTTDRQREVSDTFENTGNGYEQ